MENYTITNNEIRFSFCFDGSLDPYYTIIRDFKTLSLGYFFNNPIILTPHMKKLTLGDCFNRHFIPSPKITYLTLGYSFDQRINLSKNIQILFIGYCFNQPIKLTKKITYVTFTNCRYDQLIILTKNIIRLAITSASNQPVILPKALHTVYFSHMRIQPTNLPKYITEITFYARPNQPIILTSNLIIMTSITDFHDVLDNIPNGTKHVSSKRILKSYVNNIPNCTKISYL